ncbi:extracellular solute-binding protein [Cohnella sp. JJ-181]|uniref:extracellular solute-binding protein n=1 Tax=Cohnella rhizoplanae TaxID=2974897 RepID=UPI0022FF5639|nr:extracellular solute-binding protein [Cohnella sp. JJ-181]CAI6018281.1 hypothetical protein COHCIP112018_00198 [Cohnella sp. JJ-181]
MEQPIIKGCAALLTAAALLGCLMTGCRSDGSGEAARPDTSSGVDARYPGSVTYWVAMDQDAAVTLRDYGEMGLYKQLEKATGTRVKFQHPEAAEFEEQFSLMMATGELPDVVYTNWADNYPDKAIQEGKILRLNEIIEEYAPNLSRLLKEKPHIKKAITSAEGNIYMFPAIADDPQIFVYHGLMVRKDWLDRLNLKPPGTIGDWERMLIAFRDGDPNGNGERDEVPFFYRQTDMESSYPFIGAYGITTGMYHEGGTVKYGPMQPAFKSYLTLMNKWYEEGLIDRDYLTSDTKVRDGLMLGDRLGSMAGWAGSNMGAYMQLEKQENPAFRLIGVPFPTLRTGGKALSKPAPLISGQGSAISASARHPEQIAAWLDYGYGSEGSVLYNFGVEGESYTMVNGKPKYTDLILHNPNGLSISQALAAYALQPSGGPFASDLEADRQWHADPEQAEAMTAWIQADHAKELPPSLLQAQEQAKYAYIMTDLNTYKDEMVNKFIMGAESLDGFDSFTRKLVQLGIQEAVALYQTAYDRYLEK